MESLSLAPLSDMRPATLDKIQKAVRQLLLVVMLGMIQIAKAANV